MSQVHQSRPVIREDGIKSSALQVRQDQGVEKKVARQKETETNGATGNVKKGDQSSKARRGSKGDRVARDPNLDHEAVKMYRDTFLLCPSFGRRKDIVATVTNVRIWQAVLNEWRAQKWNPLKVNWMLSDYERREQNGTHETSERVSERKRTPQDMQARVSKWRQSHLSCVPEGAGVRFRANSKTLEQVVTEALRQNNRS